MTPDLSRIDCLGELMREALLTYKSNTALIEADRHREQRRLTYLDALTEAETVGATLQGTVGFGERCAVLMGNQSRWITGAMGVFFIGGVLVPLDYKLTAQEQLALLKHARPKALLVDYPIYRDLLREDGASVLAGIRVLVAGKPERAALDGAEEFPEGNVVAAERCEHRARSRADVACLVYSSGTSGSPKGCLLTHDNYLQQAEVLARMFAMEEGDRYFSILPTNHAIDFMCGGVIPYLFGATVVHQRTLRPEFLAPTMKRYRVTHIAVVPRILKALKEKIEEQLAELPEWQHTLIRGLIEVNDVATMRQPNHALSRRLLFPILAKFGGRLRMMFAGGAFVEPELANFFYRLGMPVVIGYGLTEACTVLTVNDLKPFRANTVGRPVDGVEVELRDQSADGVGEVYARGRTIMKGYLDADDLTAETLVDGFLRTGDLGRFDASGHLRLVGRTKNMIVTEGGKNVYPEDVENAFESLPCEELAVMAENFIWPDRGMDVARLCAVVRPRGDGVVDDLLAELTRLNQGLKDYKRIGTLVLLDDEFPRTASMKVKRAELARLVRERGLKGQALQEIASSLAEA